MIHVDTFIIDLLREAKRGHDGPAVSRLREIGDEPIQISVFVLAELLVGVELSTSPKVEKRRVESICNSIDVVYPNARFASLYARLVARLQRHGTLISTMDLLNASDPETSDPQ